VLLAVSSGVGCGPSDTIDEVRQLQETGRHGEALESLRRLLELRPDDAEVKYLYGLSLIRDGEPGLAIWTLREAMRHEDWLVSAGVQLAASQLATGNHDGALVALDEALALEPDNMDGLLLRARARIDSRLDYEGALADADHVLEIDPDAIEAHVYRSVALLGLERVEEAGESLRVLQESHAEVDLTGFKAARFCIANALFAFEDGRKEDAAERYEGCLETYPDNELVVAEAVEFFDGDGKYDRSLEILRAALEADPAMQSVRIAIAARLRARGRADEAEEVLREATEFEGALDRVDAWMALADHFRTLDDYDAAADAVASAVDAAGEPTNDLAFAHADALVMADRYDAALEAASGLEIPAQRHLVVGRVRLAQGRPAEALEELSAGLALWPDNAIARYYTALAAERLGDFDRAIAEYRYVMRIDTEAADARLRLMRLYEAEGNYSIVLVIAGQGQSRLGPNLDLDARLVLMRVAGRLGRLEASSPYAIRYVGRPGAWAQLVAASAEGARARGGPLEAAKVVFAAEKLDLADPRNVIALRSLVSDLVAGGDEQKARRIVASVLAKHPSQAQFLAARGLLLERVGGPPQEVRAVYQQALEADPNIVEAWLGLARLSSTDEERLAAYERAQAIDEKDIEARIGAADALSSMGRSSEAIGVLESVLDDRSYEAEAARRLADLELSRAAADDRVLDHALRAARFGGRSPDDFDRLARVYELRGNTARATEAREHAAELRDLGSS